MSDEQARSAEEVFNDHLREANEGTVENDFARNYGEDLVILTGRGIYRGRDGLMYLADLLRKELPNARFKYRTRLVDRNIAFLEWTARADGAKVEDGADSFVIRDGRIVAQTIHYTVEPSRRVELEPG